MILRVTGWANRGRSQIPQSASLPPRRHAQAPPRPSTAADGFFGGGARLALLAAHRGVMGRSRNFRQKSVHKSSPGNVLQPAIQGTTEHADRKYVGALAQPFCDAVTHAQISRKRATNRLTTALPTCTVERQRTAPANRIDGSHRGRCSSIGQSAATTMDRAAHGWLRERLAWRDDSKLRWG